MRLVQMQADSERQFGLSPNARICCEAATPMIEPNTAFVRKAAGHDAKAVCPGEQQ